ncbi:hypothetical protein Tco_0291009 [Tanacetum coccineum]
MTVTTAAASNRDTQWSVFKINKTTAPSNCTPFIDDSCLASALAGQTDMLIHLDLAKHAAQRNFSYLSVAFDSKTIKLPAPRSEGWLESPNVRMALGAQLKLGFIDGTFLKPDVGDAEFSICHVSCERDSQRYRKSNGPLVYHLKEIQQNHQGYPDWYKGKKAKKLNTIAAHMNSGFDEYFSGGSPFDMGIKNEIGLSQNGGLDQKLVVIVVKK